jgi:uncharacterized protein YndB with AHSA1/START domain
MRKTRSALERFEARRSKTVIGEVRVASRFVAPPADVFDAWLDAEIARQWLFATASHRVARFDIDARIGGRFRALDIRDGSSVAYAGRYLEIVPGRRLVFTLALPESTGSETRVTVTIAQVRSASSIALLHEHVPAPLVAGLQMRWTGMFYGLGLLLDARPRRQKLFNAHCRFEPLPIDYVTELSSSHHHQESS